MKSHGTKIIAFAALLATPAMAADRITVRDAITLATALRNLDGHVVIVKDATVMQPWEFGSGSLRLRIANDLAILAAVERTAENSRNQIVREILKRGGGTEIKMGTADFDDFTRQYGEVLDQPAPGTQDLSRIKASELKLDRNEIPGTVIAALKPILELDQ